MSTISMATASLVWDQTLGDEPKIANHICILVATQDNGTLFPHDSFQEVGLVELCISLGQAHLEGVLWLLETEGALTFQSTSKLMAMICLFGGAIAWYNEPIRLHIHPPTGTQVREYVAVRGRCPSGTQAQIQGEEVVSQSPSLSPTLKGGPNHNFI